MKWPAVALFAALFFSSPAIASETIAYTYDAHGRLVAAAHSGSVNNGQTTAISYDSADNRATYAVTNMSISIANAVANEGSPLAFTVTRSGSTTSAASASWATSNGTAIAGTNYTASNGTVSFAAGATSATISVPTIADHVATANLIMTVALSAPSAGAVLGTPTATGTINNTDLAASLAIASASANEGAPLVFTVTRSGNTAPAVSASWGTSNGTAIAGVNYTGSSGTVAFAANATTATITVPTIVDHLVTASLTMNASLSAPSVGATLGTPSATGTINNVDTGWSSSLTAGSYQICAFTCGATMYGYMPSVAKGSMTNTIFNGYTISNLRSLTTQTLFGLTGTSAPPPNSGWVSIVVPGVGTLQRSAATYSVSSNVSSWTWTTSTQVTSGGVTIQ